MICTDNILSMLIQIFQLEIFPIKLTIGEDTDKVTEYHHPFIVFHL